MILAKVSHHNTALLFGGSTYKVRHLKITTLVPTFLLMPNSQDLASPKHSPKQLAKLIKQLDRKDQLRFLEELASILSPSLLEAMKIEVDQAWMLSQMDGTEEQTELDEQPARHFEFKKIKNKHYAYLRWREDGCHKSEYLGLMPFLPGYTYTLNHKKNGNKTTFTSLGLELVDDQIYLKVEILKPFHTIYSYYYPECLNTVLNKKEWIVQEVTSPRNEKEEAPKTCPSDLLAASTYSTKPEVRTENRNAGETELQSDTLKPEKVELAQAKTREPRSQPIRIPNPEILKGKNAPILEIPNKLVPQVYATMRQWANLSQSLCRTFQWTVVDKGNKVTLRATQEDKTIVEYNRVLRSVTSPHPVPTLIEKLQQIANAVSSSQLVDTDTKAQALKLKTRLQGAPQDNSPVLLAYLLGLPAPKKQHHQNL